MSSREQERRGDFEPSGLTSPPRRKVNRGSWIEDDEDTLGTYLRNSMRVHGEREDVPPRKESRNSKSSNRDSRRLSTMPATRRPQIQGPQPQPLQPSMLYTNASPVTPDAHSGSNPRYLTSNSNPHNYAPRSPGQYSNAGRYTPPNEEDEDYLETENDRQERNSNRKTTETSRSIVISFDPRHNESTPSLPSSEDYRHPTIPNFPPPPLPGTNRKPQSSNSYNGSKRNPTSSFFSTNSYMAPSIPEDNGYRHGSFASSHVIPSSWGSGPPGFWDGTDPERDSRQTYQSPGYGASDYEDFDVPGDTLVRQASLGKKTRAKMTDIASSSSNSSSEKANTPLSSKKLRDVPKYSSPTTQRSSIYSTISRDTVKPLTLVGSKGVNWEARHNDEKPIALDEIPSRILTPLAITTDQESIRSVRSMKLPFWKRGSRGSMRNSMRKSLEVPPSKTTRNASPSPLNNLVPISSDESLARPRPPRLNMEAVREAEARGSLTSLPDLIRRATKLAAVLETGRPDSRWGPGSGNTSLIGTETSSHLGQNPESISDILNSFPPPAAGYPNLKSARASAAWPLPQDLQVSPLGPNNMKKKRQVCGLPMWAFILLILLGLAVITAAIVVPLQLIALSKQNNKSSALTVAQCQTQLPCLNGGISSVVNGTACSCTCPNNFDGTNCGLVSDPTCEPFIYGTNLTAEVGNGIPRLLNLAAPTYRVPLNTTIIVGVFDAQNVSCALQNALVTFAGRTTRIEQTNGTTSTSALAATATGGVDTASGGSKFVLDEDVLDFCRVAMLYLVQVRGVDVANTANAALEASFNSGVDYGVLAVGGGAIVDMTEEMLNPGGGLSEVGEPVVSTTMVAAPGMTSMAAVKKRV